MMKMNFIHVIHNTYIYNSTYVYAINYNKQDRVVSLNSFIIIIIILFI